VLLAENSPRDREAAEAVCLARYIANCHSKTRTRFSTHQDGGLRGSGLCMLAVCSVRDEAVLATFCKSFLGSG
jgi:hypothetical protein